MIYIAKKHNEIKYDEKFAKKLHHVIIVNDEQSSNTGDLFSIWNQAAKVFISSELGDFYDYLRNTRLNKKQNILIIGAKNTKEETILRYKNLLEFYYFYQEEYLLIKKEMNKVNKNISLKTDNSLVKDSIDKFISLNKDGKYIRAILISLAYKISSKKKDKKYLALASAYETFQTSILIHDDIIDQAELRRNKPTVTELYKKDFGSLEEVNPRKAKHTALSLALCVGDLGLYQANKIIVDNYAKEFPKLFSYYNEIVLNTIKGEILDVILPFKSEFDQKYEINESDVLDIARLKTAYYSIVGPFILGLILGKSSSRRQKQFESALLDLGIAFQIKDDILGIFGLEEKLGKKVYSDVFEYKQTILFNYVINSKYKKAILKYYGKKNLNKSDIIAIKKIFTDSGALKYTEDLLKELINNTYEKIMKINFNSEYYKNIFLGFIDYLMLRDR